MELVFYSLLSLLILIGKVFESFTTGIPDIFKNKEFKQEESLGCRSCEAEIIFKESIVSKNCIYCGVENYRANFARQLELVLARLNIENRNSLVELEHSYKERMFELLVVPSTVYSVFIFLPVILFFGIKLSSYF